MIVNDIYHYKTYQDLVFWHRGKFHVSAKMLSQKVSDDLLNEKYRLETLFPHIPFYGLDKVAVGFGDVGYQWTGRLVVWCDDDICKLGERWITCHPDSPLANEKAPEWIRDFCRQINSLFENNPDIKAYIRDINIVSKPNIHKERERLTRFVTQHQQSYAIPLQSQKGI